mmetsp:Transcript_9263/g.28535  ORF Transcript_9263/g.28535 Transcript_9263/m.28535 type:complete len:235 (+) Transcript_9263:195-899(+)
MSQRSSSSTRARPQVGRSWFRHGLRRSTPAPCAACSSGARGWSSSGLASRLSGVGHAAEVLRGPRNSLERRPFSMIASKARELAQARVETERERRRREALSHSLQRLSLRVWRRLAPTQCPQQWRARATATKLCPRSRRVVARRRRRVAQPEWPPRRLLPLGQRGRDATRAGRRAPSCVARVAAWHGIAAGSARSRTGAPSTARAAPSPPACAPWSSSVGGATWSWRWSLPRTY